MMHKDHAILRRLDALDNTEVLSAHYVKQKFPMHYHDTFCIGILEEGSEILSFSSHKIIIPAHSIILINPFEVHSNYAVDADGWKYKMMYVNPDVMDYTASLMGFPKGKISFKQQSLWDDSVFRSIQALFSGLELRSQDIEDQFTDMLKGLISRYGSVAHEDRQSGHDRMEAVRSVLDKQYGTKLYLDDLAKTAGMDKFSLIRAFKQFTGLTPLSYVVYKRVQKAKKLIAENMKLSHVALETGFYDQSHFTRYFKTYVGVTPASYLSCCNILQDFHQNPS